MSENEAVEDLSKVAEHKAPDDVSIGGSTEFLVTPEEPSNFLPMPVHIAKKLTSIPSESGAEICGLILAEDGDETKEWEVVQVTNCASGNAEFIMDQQELISIFSERFDDVIGTFHSHPSGRPEPSGQDIAYAQVQWRYFIISSGHVFEWSFTRKERTIEVKLLSVV